MIICSFYQTVFANSINPVAYRTMQMQSYRMQNRNNMNYGVMPYWQAQSRYSTRNRVYQNYSHYDNVMQRQKALQSMRGYR